MNPFAAPFLMAPMAGVTDSAFRARLARNGCRARATEMISAAALVRRHKATLAMANPPDLGPETVIQLFGAKPDELAGAARAIAGLGWERLDFNMGCPVRKVAKSGSGAALMADPDNAARCLGALRENFSGALTVKLRLGADLTQQNYLDIARLAARTGLDGVTLHGRTRVQLYGGSADWTAVDRLVADGALPVAGNGDIGSGGEAVGRLGAHGVAAVMIGRAAMGRPWIFRDAHALAEGGPQPAPPAPEAVAEDLWQQFRDLETLTFERRAVSEIKKFIAASAKGFPGAVALRDRTMRAATASEIRARLDEFAALDAADREAA